jgi:hypothetical protein
MAASTGKLSLRPILMSVVLALSLVSLFQNCAPMTPEEMVQGDLANRTTESTLLAMNPADPIVSVSHDPAGQRVTIALDHQAQLASARVTDSLNGNDSCSSVPVSYSAVLNALSEAQVKKIELDDGRVIAFGGPTLETKLASGAEATHFLGSGAEKVLVDYEPLLSLMSAVRCP